MKKAIALTCFIYSSTIILYYSYSKREDLVQGSEEMQEFDFLLVSAEEYHYYRESHDLVGKSESFPRLDWSASPGIPIPLAKIANG